MNTRKLFALIAVASAVLGVLFLACDDKNKIEMEDDTSIVEDNNIIYLKSSLGGCNSKTLEMIKSDGDDVRSEDKNDTTIIQIQKDTLTIQVGLNYICCAPFVTDCDIVNDSIFILITDTAPSQSSYCRCHCYYTFKYYFTGLADKKYYWRITLIDPREKDKILFDEGVINGGVRSIEGTYVGTYTTIGPELFWKTSPTIEFKNGKYAGSGFSDGSHFDIQSGNFTVNLRENKLIFDLTNIEHDPSAPNIDFMLTPWHSDWYLSGEYEYKIDGDKLTFSKNVVVEEKQYEFKFELNKSR